MHSGGKRAIMWFRKGLRLHDNPALLAATAGAQYVFPIFVLDPFFVSSAQYK
jgi:cryptochrome